MRKLSYQEMSGKLETGVEKASGVFSVFPFVDSFEAVVAGEVSLQYIGKMLDVLEPAVDVLSMHIEKGGREPVLVDALVYISAAVERSRVVQAYSYEIENQDEGTRHELVSDLLQQWAEFTEVNHMIFVPYSSRISEFLGESIEDMWRIHAASEMLTGAEVLECYGESVASVRAVVLGDVLLETGKSATGTRIQDLGKTDSVKPLIPAKVYRAVIDWLRFNSDKLQNDQVDRLVKLQDLIVQPCDFGYGKVSIDRALAWVWMVLCAKGDAPGFCYQNLFSPKQRFSVCQVLGKEPKLSTVKHYVDKFQEQWAGVEAVIVVQQNSLHVSEPGNFPVDFDLSKYAETVIGMFAAAEVPVDYFARGLVDDFINKHKRKQSVEEVPPVDATLGRLTLDASGNKAPFVVVASRLYAGVDELLSPRAETAVKYVGGSSVHDEVLGVDAERMVDLLTRLTDGAVIHEDYFTRSLRRFSRARARPRLDVAGGRMFHVFAEYPSNGGGGLGPWKLDKDWAVPGWTSYVAIFKRDFSATLSFVDPSDAQDVRMDCSGEAMIDFGNARFNVNQTVLWFSRSVRFKLQTKTSVCLRISVPASGSALAFGATMRRYLHVPGYATVVRSFDVVSQRSGQLVDMVRDKKLMMVGTYLYRGAFHAERGRIPFRLGKLASGAPVKLVVKADPADALDFVAVGGLRLYKRAKDYVTVLCNVAEVELHISLLETCQVMLSAMQIVREHEFDIQVAATTTAVSHA